MHFTTRHIDGDAYTFTYMADEPQIDVETPDGEDYILVSTKLAGSVHIEDVTSEVFVERVNEYIAFNRAELAHA